MFDEKEVYQIVLAILLMTYLIAFSKLTLYNILIAFIFAFFILVPHVIAHKITAINYLANSKFKLLEWRRYWFFEDSTFKYPFPIWLVLPILVAFATLGKVLLFTIESCQIKWKPNKRIGRWYTELQEHEISNIGLAGPLTNLAFAFIAGIVFSFVSLPLIKEFAILNAWFAFFCLLPIGGLDGTKILFGGKIRYFIPKDWNSIGDILIIRVISCGLLRGSP